MHACMLSLFSHAQLCVIPWTAAHQAPPSKGLSRQEYWSGLPFPSPRECIETPKTKQTNKQKAQTILVIDQQWT